LVLAILARLREPHYGYALRQALAAAGLEIAEGTLYPLLRRLESQGLLTSEWFVEDNRPRRYYRTSAEGRRALTAMSAEWRELVKVLKRLLARE
jgi:DNA-binding PadR family transcriptional regulator